MDNTEMMARHTAVMEQIGVANGEPPKAAPAPIDKPTEPADNVEVTQVTPVDAALAPDTDPEGDEEHDEDSADSDGDDPTTLPRKPRASRKIGKLTKEKYEALRRADAAELRLQMLEQYLQPQQTQQPSVQTPQAASGELTLEQFGYDQVEFSKALRQQAIQEARQAARAEIQQEQTQRQMQEQGTRFNQRVAELEKEMPGAWKRAVEAPLQTTPIMEQVIFRSEIGPKVGVYLADHLDEANAIARLHPMEQAVAMGRIEAMVKAAPAISPRPPKAVPAVSAPSAPLPSGSSSVKKSLENETIEEAAARIREWNRNH